MAYFTTFKPACQQKRRQISKLIAVLEILFFCSLELFNCFCSYSYILTKTVAVNIAENISVLCDCNRAFVNLIAKLIVIIGYIHIADSTVKQCFIGIAEIYSVKNLR